jgi:hypothetical protein
MPSLVWKLQKKPKPNETTIKNLIMLANERTNVQPKNKQQKSFLKDKHSMGGLPEVDSTGFLRAVSPLKIQRLASIHTIGQ